MTINDIRNRLRNSMIEKSPGYSFEKVFGCDPKNAFVYPHVRVRVELRALDQVRKFAFQVHIDFALPNGCTVKQAAHFTKASQQALRKARWAETLVDGRVWSFEEVIER